ncbi:hypothetical protein ACFV99_32010 [Streptomyces sp. NPDC059944]|uniref:hypothetical protein n=1 Tax=unclassified Streptomyces TaxID=2593676 RepID=UPI003646A7F2
MSDTLRPPGAFEVTLAPLPARRRPPDWAHPDPIDELADRMAEFVAAAVHPDEVAAALESDGMSDDQIRERYGVRNSFALAEELYGRVARHHPEPVDPPHDPWRIGLLGCLLRGIVFALPALGHVLAGPLLAGPKDAFGLPAGTVPMLAGALCGWTWNQGLAHRAYTWLGLGDRAAARRVLLVGTPAGVLLGSLVALAAAGPARPGAVVFAAGQSAYLGAATVLLVMGRERLLLAALAPMTAGAVVTVVHPVPDLARTALLLVSLAAVALLGLLEVAPSARESGKDGRWAGLAALLPYGHRRRGAHPAGRTGLPRPASAGRPGAPRRRGVADRVGGRRSAGASADARPPRGAESSGRRTGVPRPASEGRSMGGKRPAASGRRGVADRVGVRRSVGVSADARPPRGVESSGRRTGVPRPASAGRPAGGKRPAASGRRGFAGRLRARRCTSRRPAGTLPYALFGLGSGVLVLHAALGDVLAGAGTTVAAPAAVALTLSMGPAEWLLYRFRSGSLAGLRASGSARAFRRVTGGVLVRCLAAYLAALLALTLGTSALWPHGTASTGGVGLAGLLLLGAVLWTGLLLQSFGAVTGSAVVVCAAALARTAALATRTGDPDEVALLVHGTAAVVQTALVCARLRRATAHR